MRPGDLYWVDYPSPNGREQAGRRPSLVLQDEVYARESPLVVTLPLTSTPRVRRFPAVVQIPATTANGLVTDSYILVFQARAVDRARIRDFIGVLEPAFLSQVYDALDKLTGRPLPPE